MRVEELDGKYYVMSNKDSVLGEFTKSEDADKFMKKYSLLKSYSSEANEDTNSIAFKKMKKNLKDMYKDK